MKISKVCAILLLPLLALRAHGADDSSKPAPPIEGTVMMVDLRANVPGIFQYGTWKDNIGVSKSGLAIMGGKGALGRGGMGCAIATPMDLSHTEYVEVALGVVPNNEVPQITIALNDEDGTQFTARVNIDQIVPGQPVWLRARRADFALNSIEPGKDSRMDWSKVTRWHLQGDWKTDKSLDVIFIALRVRNAP
jgi:hypothetical protein